MIVSTENQSSERSPVVHSVARRAVVALGALLLGLIIGLFIAIAGLLVFGRIVSKIPGYEPSAFWASVGLFVAIALAYGLIVVLVAVVTQLIGGKVGKLGGRAVRWLSQGVFAVAIFVMLLLASTSAPPVAGLSRSDILSTLPWYTVENTQASVQPRTRVWLRSRSAIVQFFCSTGLNGCAP